MALATDTRTGRSVIGNNAELKFIAYLLWNGKTVTRVGQETWMPAWVHAKIRFKFDDEAIETLKHFPDLATNKALVQVKSAPSEQGYDDVTIEQASYRASKRLMDNGIPVLIVWLYQDGKSFCGEWVNNITPKESNTPRTETNGSHTPLYLVSKAELKPAKEFFDNL